MEKDDIKTLINSQRATVMGISAIWIFLFHLWLMWGAGEEGRYFLGIGYVGVDFFFLLSGMGLVYSIEKHSVLTFYLRRIERVFLPYAVMAVLFFTFGNWDFRTFIRNLLGINFITKDIYSFLWFVPSIMIFYLVFPLFYMLFRRAASKEWMMAAVLMAWLAASQWIMHDAFFGEYFHRTNLFLFTNRVPIFLTGAYLGWRMQRGTLKWKIWEWAGCGAMLALGLFSSCRTYLFGVKLLLPESYSFLPAYLTALSGVPLLSKAGSLMERYGRKPGAWILAFFRFFGRISLEFYCVHECVAQYIKKLTEGYVPAWAVCIFMFIGSVVAALALDTVCQGMRKGIVWIRNRIKETVVL